MNRTKITAFAATFIAAVCGAGAIAIPAVTTAAGAIPAVTSASTTPAGGAATAARAGAAARATPPPVMYGSDGGGSASWSQGKVRPKAIYFGSGGDLFVKPLTWAKWGTYAWARGIRWRNMCSPTCVRGTFKKSPASVTLWRVRAHKGHLYYSRMTLCWRTRTGAHKTIYSYSTLPGGTSPFWH
jgi:hypothetical protein